MIYPGEKDRCLSVRRSVSAFARLYLPGKDRGSGHVGHCSYDASEFPHQWLDPAGGIGASDRHDHVVANLAVANGAVRRQIK
jgi:hypothetical protein